MLNKLFRKYNQNRRSVWAIIAFIAFCLILLYTIFGILRYNKKKEQENNEISTSSTRSEVSTQNPITSVITGESTSKEETEENVDIIKNFVNACNEQKYENAYELLTDDCKTYLYKSANDFKERYCKTLFASKKTYSLDLFLATGYTHTYKITYYNDNLLQTGTVDSSNNFEDYITIVEKDGEKKVNISSFIVKEEINKTTTQDDIEITVKSKLVYKDYEEYDIVVKNNGNGTICLSEAQNSEDICLYDEKDVKYKSYIHEITEDDLTLKSKYEKEIKVKFGKIYSNTKKIEKIEFNKVVTSNGTITIAVNIK